MNEIIKVRLRMARQALTDIEESRHTIFLKVNYIESRQKELSECLDEIEERSRNLRRD